MLNLALFFVGGFALGAGLMWYYWRRYKTPAAFKAEVAETTKDVVNAVEEVAETTKKRVRKTAKKVADKTKK